jgi:hypothetical protein
MFLDPTAIQPPSRFGGADNSVRCSSQLPCPLVRTAKFAGATKLYKHATPIGVNAQFGRPNRAGRCADIGSKTSLLRSDSKTVIL